MKKTGDFTLPGEAGYEKLTLRLAKKWGADVIRDSDGTELSEEIMEAGYEIYSTVCVIRGHNEWAKKHPETIQQTFLMAGPAVASMDRLEISLLEQFYQEQFQVNESNEAMEYWQVFDRTTETEVEKADWYYDTKTRKVVIQNAQPWHQYTVNFLAYRIWEEISMYNHVTNNWDKEHLIPIDPRYPETQQYLLEWMENWCKEHPSVDVVRFTSMFYNFVWIWGSEEKRRNLFTDWGSYDYSVSLRALLDFEKQYGYKMQAEDFINQGKLHATHMPPNTKKKDWMEFTGDFVRGFGRKLIDIVHAYGKKAYVFYDDSWIGIEPYSGRFTEFGFDGLIKCVFSGYEVRLCAGVPVKTHEIRLHPYLFPVGLGGKPTFSEGGNPEKDLKEYWISVRRALLREPVERIGLGGYLHLTEDFPGFQDAVEEIAEEFRELKTLHTLGKPEVFQKKTAVLHSWGGFRPWTLSGHFHETEQHNLIHMNEALSGMPVEVDFISFEEAEKKDLSQYGVIINAGREGDAWSGGMGWNAAVVQRLTEWTAKGGIFIGVCEPSAVRGYGQYFQMSHVLGVDYDPGDYVCHGKYAIEAYDMEGFLPEDCVWKEKEQLFLKSNRVKVLAEKSGNPLCTINEFGEGKGIYLSSFICSPSNQQLLFRLLRLGCGSLTSWSENKFVDCAWFKDSNNLVLVNNSDKEQDAEIVFKKQRQSYMLKPYEQRIIEMTE